MRRLAPQRMPGCFPSLPSFQADEQFLHALGRTGGLCDCGDIEDSPDSLGDTAAGWPIFGQFVAHDITADRSILRHHTNTAELHNARSPQLDLECLYGDGPTGHPFLYQRDDPAKFLLGSDGADVQRNAEGIAIIGDPRNDSHMLVSQLHLAMLKAHNAFVDEARLDGSRPTCSTKRPGSYAGTINGSFLTSFCLRSSDRHLRIRCFGRARDGFTLGMADLYRSSLPTLPIGTVILRFATVTN